MASFVSPRTSCLRSVAPTRHVFAAKPAYSPFSTSTLIKASTHPKLSILPSQRTSAATRRQPQQVFRAFHAPSPIAIRHASTSTPATSNTTSEEILTWDRFFDLRRKRRYINLGSSLITAAAAIGVFGPVIAQQDIDGWAAQISGIDPIIVLGATTFLVAAGGWLCGPSFGTALFKVWAGRKGWNMAIAEKEKSFYARIRRFRADPSSSSPQNPIPDYYGEKIASVKDYRRWLKDQRAFNLKKNKNMI